MKIEKLIKKLKTLSKTDQIKTALFAAEIVLPVYESYFPGDNRVRLAIELGKKGTYAADAAYAAAHAAHAAVAIRGAIIAGAKKKTIHDYMCRIADSE